MTKPKEMKLVFAPGCFDGFEGTQEELDELIAHIKAGFESGELLENSEEIDPDDLPDDIRQALDASMDEAIGDAEEVESGYASIKLPKRTVH